MYSDTLPKGPGVYVITHQPSGMQYVGGTKNLFNRKIQHVADLRHRGHWLSEMQGAWDRDGPGAFTFEILELVLRIEDILETEQKYLDALRPAYNKSPTAGSRRGSVQPEAESTAHGQHLRAWQADPANYALWRSRLTGKVRSAEARAKVSKANKGKKRSPEACAALGDRTRGRPVSLEARAKMSASRIGKKPTEEHRRNVSQGLMGHEVSAETRAKISKANKGRRHSEEARQKMSESQRKRAPQSPEVRARMAESIRASWVKRKAAQQAQKEEADNKKG